MKSSSRQKPITLARILSVLIQFKPRSVDLLTFYNKCIFCHSFSTEQIQVAVLLVKASHLAVGLPMLSLFFITFKERNFLIANVEIKCAINSTDLYLRSFQSFIKPSDVGFAKTRYLNTQKQRNDKPQGRFHYSSMEKFR